MKPFWCFLMSLVIGLAASDSRADISKPTVLFRGLAMTTAREIDDQLLAPLPPAGIWSLRTELNLRPDIKWEQGSVCLTLKPRVDLYAEHYTGFLGEDATESSFYVHEWSIRLSSAKHWDLLYGLENIQWGPSYLTSPSNPFDAENGRNSPQMELRAADYLRLNMYYRQLVLSLIANTGEGRRDDLFGPFEPAYAVKFDTTLERRQFSLIASHQGQHDRAGFYSTWQISDALLFYNEMGYETDDAEILLGLSYSTGSGKTFSIEYCHNQGGDPDLPVVPLLIAQSTLSSREYLLRENYLFFQVLSPAILSSLDSTWRVVYNMDDSSAGLIFVADYGITDCISTFVNAYGFGGDTESEFGSILKWGISAGIDFRY